MEIENDRFLVYSMIIHCADFFGNAKKFEISKSWAEKVNIEFSNQVNKLKLKLLKKENNLSKKKKRIR